MQHPLIAVRSGLPFWLHLKFYFLLHKVSFNSFILLVNVLWPREEGEENSEDVIDMDKSFPNSLLGNEIV